MDVTRWRGVFCIARIHTLAHWLARVEAPRTILSRPLGATLFLGLFGPIGEAEALTGDFHRIGAASGEPITGRLAFERIGFGHFAVEIHIGGVSQLLAQLVAQHLGLDGLDAADRNIAKLERTIAHADQAVHFKAKGA